MNVKIKNVSPSNENRALINNLSDDIWIITDKNSADTVQIPVGFEECNDTWTIWARKLLLEIFNGYADSAQRISANETTFKNKYNRIYPIAYWATQNYPDKSLTSWSVEILSELTIALTFNEISTPTRSSKDKKLQFRKKNTVLRQLDLLMRSGDFYRQGKIHDGYLEHIESDFFDMVVEPEFISRGLADEYSICIESGSLAHIPTEISLVLLSSAIDVIRSSQTSILLSYFKAQRGINSQPVESLRSNPNSNDSLFKNIRYLRDGRLRKTEGSWTTELITEYKTIEIKHGRDGEDNIFESYRHIKDYIDLKNAVRDVYDSCMIIILCLSGIRIHELRNINATDYGKEPDGTWVFKTAIDKTHNGVKQLRVMSGLLAEAANILCKLSYIDKYKSTIHGNLKLIGRYDSRFVYQNRNKTIDFKPSSLSRENLSERVNLFYQGVKEKVADQDEDEYPLRISPHGFRHAFADFAIRRFDGHVFEALRQHFRHRHSSTFTKTYTDKKANIEVQDAAAKRYLRDLIKRMVGEHSKDFSGAMALYIRNEVKRLNIVSEAELNQYIDETIDKLEHLVPHEFGFCLVLKGREKLAECKNCKTGLIEVKNGQFELCSRCPNSLRSAISHKSNIERIVISHEAFLEKFPLKTKQHDASAKVVKQGLSLLNEME